MKMNEFIKLFEAYNQHTNLMSKNDVLKLAEKHIPDCLAINLFFEKYFIPQKIADIGTGGGFPAIPIAIKFPDIEVFAVDSILKKIKFIELVKQELQIKNIYPICTRIEDFPQKNTFDTIVSRALAPLNSILEYAAPFVKINGYIVAYKAKSAGEELEQAENALKVLGIKFIEKISYNLPDDNTERCLMIFQKIKQTPNIYPRKNNLARKNPL